MPEFQTDLLNKAGGVHSAWMGGKTVHCVLSNGYEIEIRFTDGTSGRFDWVDDDGEPIKGKLRCKSMGTHIRAITAQLSKTCP